MGLMLQSSWEDWAGPFAPAAAAAVAVAAAAAGGVSTGFGMEHFLQKLAGMPLLKHEGHVRVALALHVPMQLPAAPGRFMAVTMPPQHGQISCVAVAGGPGLDASPTRTPL